MGLILTLAIAAIFATTAARNRSISNPDAFDYLQMALHVSDGKGFQSGHAYPGHLRWFYEHGFGQQKFSNGVPILYRYPLPIIIEAEFIRMGFHPYMAAQLYSGMGYLFSGIILYLLTFYLFKSIPVSMAITTAFLISGGTIENAVSGLTETTATFLFLLNIIVLAVSFPLYRRACLSGLVAGIAYLNRTPSLCYMLPMIFLGLAMEKSNGELPRKKEYAVSSLIAVGGFFFVLLPHMWRNFILSKRLFFDFYNTINLLMGTDVPNWGCDWEENYSIVYVLYSYFPAITRKFFFNLLSGVYGLRELLLVNKVLVLPFLFGIFFCLWRKDSGLSSSNRELRKVVLLWVSALGCNLLGVSLFMQTGRFYAVFWALVPVLSFVGTNGILNYFIRIIKPIGNIGSTVKITAFSSLFIACLYVSFNFPLWREVKTPSSVPQRTLLAIREVRGLLSKEEGAIVSDISWATAVELYGCNLLSIRMPGRYYQLEQISRVVEIRGVLLSHKLLEGATLGKEALKYISTKFPELVILSDGSRLYLPGERRSIIDAGLCKLPPYL